MRISLTHKASSIKRGINERRKIPPKNNGEKNIHAYTHIFRVCTCRNHNKKRMLQAQIPSKIMVLMVCSGDAARKKETRCQRKAAILPSPATLRKKRYQ